MKMLLLLVLIALATSDFAEAFDVGGRDISRKNFRQIQRDQHYYRVDKTFNTVFYRRHFEADGETNDLLRYLISSAELYGVPPVAVLGAIMGEHSMNQRSQMKQQGEKGINFLGKTFGKSGEKLVNELNVRFRGANGEASFGPGQIQPYIATAMIPKIKDIRTDATEEELDKYSWRGAINIICAYMNYAAECYEEEGFAGEKSFRDDPAVLVTLYNIGENGKSFQARAVESLALIESGEREGLWLNYFGYWVQKHMKSLNKRIEEGRTTEANPPSETNQPNP